MAELLAQGPIPDQKLNILLADGQSVRLGRAVAKGWSVPWDNMLSREHADLLLEKDLLKVSCLEKARNAILYRGKEVREFQLAIGEEFQIGETVFRLAEDRNLTPSDSTYEFQSIAPEELRQYKFHNASERLEVLSRLPDLISHAGSDVNFPKRLTDLLLEAIPKADAAAIVVDQPDESDPEESTLSVLFQSQKRERTLPSPVESPDIDNENFRPSHRLIRTALERKESQFHIWTDQDGSDAQYTLRDDFNWAFCIPIESEACTDWCLYVTGRLDGMLISLQSPSSNALRGDLRLTELIGQIMGSILQVRLLEDRQSRMTQFFSPKVARTLRNRRSEDVLAPKEGETTVLFCDLRGFSKKSEQEQDNLFALMESVSGALGVMTRKIIEHEGVIADFQGDAALGFWGWPIPPDDGPVAACRTALGINQEFMAIAQQSENMEALRVGIGIAYGTAIAGRIGTEEQAKLGVFGPVVNLASRLEGMTKQLRVPILIDETIAEYLRLHSSPEEVRCRRLCRIRPYGMKTALTVSQLLPPVEQDATITDEHIVAYESAVDSFIEGRWSETLEKLGELPVSDRAKDFLMIHIASNNYEPPTDWDGVISLSSK